MGDFYPAMTGRARTILENILSKNKSLRKIGMAQAKKWVSDYDAEWKGRMKKLGIK